MINPGSLVHLNKKICQSTKLKEDSLVGFCTYTYKKGLICLSLHWAFKEVEAVQASNRYDIFSLPITEVTQ